MSNRKLTTGRTKFDPHQIGLWLLLLWMGVCLVIAGQVTTVLTTVPFADFLKAYPEVENYLVQNVASDDINENINKARELLQLELSKSPPGEGQRREALVYALQKFTSLAEVQEEQSCNFDRYITLYYNYLASRSSQTRASLRVARIVDQFALGHAQSCADFYGAQVRERYSQVAANVRLNLTIEALLDSALRSATGPNMVEDLVWHFKQQNAPVLGSRHGQLIYSILVELAAKEHDPDAGLLSSTCDDEQQVDEETSELTIDKEQYEAIERLFNKHIRQPCQSLVSQLRDVMEPAAFDVLYHPKQQEDSFYIIWARYKLCDTMSSQVRQKLLSSLVQIACDEAAAAAH